MSITTIEAEPDLAGLPPPLLMSVSDASQLIYVLRQGHGAGRPRGGDGACVAQLIATRNGEGVSTLARDLCLVAAASMGLNTLLLAAEPAGRHGADRRADWPRSIYGMPAALRKLPTAPAELEALRVGDSALVVAAPTPGPPLQPAGWSTLIQDLRPRFNLVLIDAPALERSFTGIMLAALVDTSVVVVAAESTRASAARILRDRLAEMGGQTAGVILNKRRFHVPRAAYERL